MTAQIKLKKSSVPGKIPTTGDLDYGEIAINYADGKIYYKTASNQIAHFIDSDATNILISTRLASLGVGDSASIITTIDNRVTKAFVDALGIDAITLGGHDSSYYLNYNNFTNTPTNISTFTNDANYLDSNTVTGVIDTTYINSLVTATDSAAVINIVTSTVDSAYVQARQTPQDFAYSSLTGAPNVLDSANVSNIIIADVDATFINALTIDADTLGGQAGSHYLDYTNFINTPNVLDSANVNSLVTVAIDALVNGAPAALDTLGEIATQLGNDSDAIAAVINTLALKFNTSDFNTTFDTRLSGKSTTDLAEGTNLYYTNAKVETLVDSAYVQLRQDYAYSSLTGAPINVSTFTNDANYLDSTTVQGVVNSTYVNGLVDSVGNATNAAKLNNQAPSFYLDYNNFTNTPTIPSFGNDYVDSASVSAIITSDVDAAFINALTIDADTLGGQNSAYHLDYNNFTNTPSNVSTFVNDANYLDSTTVQGVINSTYVNGLVDSVDNATTALVATNVAVTNTNTFGTYYVPFMSSSSTGNQSIYADTSGPVWNPSLNLLTAPSIGASTAGFLAIDNIPYRFGSSTDVKMFYDGDNNTMEMELEADAQSFIITDNGTTKFTFDKATSNLIASTFTGNATNALKLDSQDGSYYLNYNNFTNTPTIPTVPTNVSSFVNDANYLDSTTVLGIINSAYVQSNQITYNTSDFTDSAFVTNSITTAINNLVDGAPGALDTLNELAAALGDDSNFAGTVTTALAGKQATLVSGTNIKTINGSSILGSGDISVSTDFSAVSEDILPLFDGVYDIGSLTKQWYDVFISNSVNIGGASLTGTTGVLSTTDDVVVGSLLADQLLISDNLITPDNTSVRQYLGDKGVVVINGNLDVDGDWLQVPRVGGTNDVVGQVTADVAGVAGVIRFNQTAGTFEGHDGTSWGSLGGISADENGNATIDANLIVTGDVISLSDETLKENMVPVTGALDKVLALNGFYYNLKSDPTTRHIGLSAQNVESQVPELVYTSNGKKAVAYGNTVALLIEAIKELKAEIEVLKNGV